MAVQSDPPKVGRVTTVANLSKTEAFPVERGDRGQPVPQTRPDPATQPPRPRPLTIPEHRQRTPGNPLAAHHAGKAGALPVRPPQRRVPARILSLPPDYQNPAQFTDPPEGVGRGEPPRGATKIK